MLLCASRRAGSARLRPTRRRGSARRRTGAGRSSRSCAISAGSCAISAGRRAFTAATSHRATGRLGTTAPVVEAVEDGFVVTLGPFPGVSRAADLDLTAHADELVVAGAALAAPLRVALERPVDPTRVKAKWKKLDRTLRVELKAK